MSIKKTTAVRFIERELRDLGVSSDCEAFKLIKENAVEAADVLHKKDLQKYIQDYHDVLPMELFL